MKGMIRAKVRGEMATVYYSAVKHDGLWFVNIQEVNVDGVAIDDRLTSADEMYIIEQMEEHLNRSMVNE